MDVGSILLAAIGIGLLIFLHELGHFLAARLAGVRVEVFSLGFGPRLCGVDWRGTDFRLSLVPFGGYVMVAGQDPSDRRYPAAQSLWAKSAGQRALFWVGGVLMNVLFAVLVFPLVFHAGVKFEAPVVGRIAPGSAAWEAQLQPGERVLAAGGKLIRSFDNLAVEVALHGGRPIALELERPGGARRVVDVTPHFDPVAGLYGLGIEPAIDPEPPALVVDPDGPAAKAGLRDGDRILRLAGAPAQDGFPDSLQVGVPIAIDVQRDGQPLQVQVTPTRGADAPPRIGVRPLPRRIAGLRPGSALIERLGLQRDDLVLAIDGAPFTGGDLAVAAVGTGRTRWLLLRDGQQLALEADATADEREALPSHIALVADVDATLVLPQPGHPAERAGMRPGDRIVAVDGVATDHWDDVVEQVTGAGERALRIDVRRAAAAPETATAGDGGELVALQITPARLDPDLGLGWQLAHLQHEVKATGVADAVRLGAVCSLDLVKQLYVTLKRLVTGDVAAKNLSGIIRISQVSYHAAQRGPSWFWYFLALLSLNLAFVNLLPIPVLDGGYLLFVLIEKIKGSPVSTRVFGYSQILGLVFVLLLVLFVTYNDILRLL
ncbi:MAG: RIP metalloprotease RseP [Planctomycetes bacterium]|nr:RIP metalloprotease RseP [Planctomycetota bacterium]